jgi:hypothetical protein
MPPRLPPQYYPLRDYLAAQRRDEVTLTFADLDALLSQPLPAAVWQRAWWTNRGTQAQAQAWLGVGWWVRWVRRRETTAAVTFVRQTPVSLSSYSAGDHQTWPHRPPATR